MPRPAFKIASVVLSSKWWWSAKIAIAVSMAYGGKHELNKKKLIYKLHLYSIEVFSDLRNEENIVLIMNASENKGMAWKGTSCSIKSSLLLPPAVLHTTQFLQTSYEMYLVWRTFFLLLFFLKCSDTNGFFWCEIRNLYPTW